jgi:hypothetical protein
MHSRTTAGLVLLAAALACTAHGLDLVSPGQPRTTLWTAALEAVAEIDSLRAGVMCLRINHGTEAWKQQDYRDPEASLIEMARDRGLAVVPESTCGAPDALPDRSRRPYQVTIQAGELKSQGVALRLRVEILPVFSSEGEGCAGTAVYTFQRGDSSWKRTSDSLFVICI